MRFVDIAIWSQTHWKWVEIKLIELGIINNPRYSICFMLDKSSMFRSGPKNKYIKPLHIIWSKFPHLWGQHNTVHVDDLDRNFAMNPSSGVLVSAYYRPDREREVASDVCLDSEAADAELIPLSRYHLVLSCLQFLC
jgi:ubiquitin-like domain-containing CTD phosphatase 1